MSRRRKSKGAPPRSRGRRFIESLDPRLLAWTRTGAQYAVIVLAILLPLLLGMQRLERFVSGLPAFDVPLTVEWDRLPTWLALPANQRIVDSLQEACGLTPDDRLNRPGLAADVATRVLQHDPGWIERLEGVEVRPNGVVSIRARFREPFVWVCHDDAAYLVDRRGERLPGSYARSSVTEGPLLILEGVQSPPPPVGRAWCGNDVRAGLKVAAAIESRCFRPQVTRVLVREMSPLRGRTRPRIDLATDRPGARIVWGRAPGDEDGVEIAASRKLALLESLYRRFGRIDLGRSYVDVTTWLDHVAMPARGTAPTHASMTPG